MAELERADGSKRAILAQAMTGDKSGAQRRLGFEHSQSGDRCGENRRLGILGQLEIGFGTIETKSAERKSETVVGLGESLAGERKLGAEVLPPADVLRPLAGANEGEMTNR